MEPSYIAALDVGGTKTAAVVASRNGPLARVSAPTPKSGSERALPEKAIELIEEAARQAGIPFDEVQVLGVASCGPFVKKDGVLGVSTPNICGGLSNAEDLPNDWVVIPLEQVLKERFAHVAMENDCVAALAAERTFGAVQDEPNCVYATWSTGIGFGLCVDGRLLRGKQGNAGHAGHMLMSETQDTLCGCGNRGDLESLISGRNLANRTNMPAASLLSAARNGDANALKHAQEAASWFGRALYNVTATLDTRTFVIGGSVWQHHGEWLMPMVLPELTSRLHPLTEGVNIVPAALGNLVADIGALSLVLPESWLPEWRRSRPWQKLAG